MKKIINKDNLKIGVVGLGYVGLPLAIEFSKKYEVIGVDIDSGRIKALNNGEDSTGEVDRNSLANAGNLVFQSDIESLNDCNIYIVTVPTPVDKHKQPDLTPLINASKDLANVINHGDIIIYESTVYPGATEEVCVPIIEKHSSKKFNRDFFVGYSPERINPGDKSKKLKDILKVTSGSTPSTSDIVDELYSSIIEAGTFKASSIKVAEASKIIENVQRDVNIALTNEFFQIFEKMNIDTNEVLDAAATKWNFMKLKPGLVGGHCIGVDPYYLLHQSKNYGYVPDLMRKGREVNDSMPSFLAKDFLDKLIRKKINPIDLEVIVLGFTFKENCPDIRNTKVYDLFNQLIRLGFKVRVFDDNACKKEVNSLYGIDLIQDKKKIEEKIAILAVGHDSNLKIAKELQFNFIYDFKSLLETK